MTVARLSPESWEALTEEQTVQAEAILDHFSKLEWKDQSYFGKNFRRFRSYIDRRRRLILRKTRENSRRKYFSLDSILCAYVEWDRAIEQRHIKAVIQHVIGLDMATQSEIGVDDNFQRFDQYIRQDSSKILENSEGCDPQYLDGNASYSAFRLILSGRKEEGHGPKQRFGKTVSTF